MITKDNLEKIKEAIKRYEYIVNYCDDGFASLDDFELIDDVKTILLFIELCEVDGE